MRIKGLLMMISIAAFLSACQTPRPIYTVNDVDLERFMGDWFVIASIPTFIEKEAYNAVESYRIGKDGRIETTFRFNKGDFEGPQKVYTPTGFVREDGSNAVWDMQFVWPIKAEYRIVYLNDDYTQTVIGRSKRDYVWIMARSPAIPADDYDRILNFLEKEGYDLSDLRKVPHGKPKN
jgi:apolipoprotein D and lipocalin family protein